MRVFRAHLRNASFVVISDVFRLVANSPASRFWVSEERAAVVISAMWAGRPLPRMRPNKREMFEEIFRRFKIEKERNPSATIYELVAEIVSQPAPKFYLTPRTVGEFIYRYKKGWYDTRCAPAQMPREINEHEL